MDPIPPVPPISMSPRGLNPFGSTHPCIVPEHKDIHSCCRARDMVNMCSNREPTTSRMDKMSKKW